MFAKDTRGTIAISTGVAGLVIVGAIGIAIDTSRAMSHSNSLQSLADTAAVAALQPEVATASERQVIVDNVVQQHLQLNESDAVQVSVKVSETVPGEDLRVELGREVDLIFGDMIGKGSVRLSNSAEAEAVYGAEALSGVATIIPSVSVVLDLSESMSDRMGNVRKVDWARSTMNSFLGRLNGDASEVRTGLYTYNWGADANSTAPLAPGTAHTSTALAVAQADTGSVPAPAVEAAVSDLVAETGTPRTLVYVADGAVDSGMSDKVGQYLTDADIFPPGAPAVCMNIPPALIDAQDQAAQHLLKAVEDHNLATPDWQDLGAFDDDKVKFDSNDDPATAYRKRELVLTMSKTTLLGNGNHVLDGGNGALVNKSAKKLTGKSKELTEQLGYLKDWYKVLRKEQELWKEQCRPVQEERVVDACDLARMEDIRLMGVDLSGQEGPAAEVTRNCVFGDVDAKDDADRDHIPDYADHDGAGGLGAPDGNTYVAADGSVYIVATDLASVQYQLDRLVREVNGTLQTADAATTRRVRLVR